MRVLGQHSFLTMLDVERKIGYNVKKPRY